MFIKEFVKNNKTSCITAPPGFGKSTIMSMLKTFLEIEVDEEGCPKTKANYLTEPVQDTSNYKLFIDQYLKITNEKKIMDEHFGRTPVISLSFRCDRWIKSYGDAFKFFMEVFRSNFKQYKYLMISGNITSIQKWFCEKWLKHENFEKYEVRTYLKTLSEYLFNHFGHRKVFVVVDDHDSVIKKAIAAGVSRDELHNIVGYYVDILNSVFKKNSEYVLGGLITGVLGIPEFGTGTLVSSLVHKSDDSDSYHIYRFLEDHRFVDFYGLTREEVGELLVYPELKLGLNTVEEARAKYHGYKSKNGREIYNLYSVLNFLKTGKIRNYWTDFNPIIKIEALVKGNFIKEHVKKLLAGDILNINLLNMTTIGYLSDLVYLLKEPELTFELFANTFFSLLMEEGYLSYVPKVTSTHLKENIWTGIKIPNNEIREALAQIIK